MRFETSERTRVGNKTIAVVAGSSGLRLLLGCCFTLAETILEFS